MARGADRISDLPEGVLHHILSLLPAEDAVRTCVLARSWRKRWLSAPALRLACSAGSPGDLDAFRRFVNGLLHARDGGPPLECCDFDVGVGSWDINLEPDGYNWIYCVLALKVRELRIRVTASPTYPFRLSFHSLSSKHLTSLELSGVHMIDDVVFRKCRKLESLKMEASSIWAMEMHSPSLKNLSIKYCFFGSQSRTPMSFPSLVSFEFSNNSGRAPMLETMPNLETATVRFGYHQDDRCKNGLLDDCGDAACRGCFSYYGPGASGSVFLHGLVKATYLNLSADPDMYVFNRDLKWCPAFNKLKTLVLSKWFLSTDLSAVIWFLHHTALLEKLTLETPTKRWLSTVTKGSYNPLEKSIAPSHLQKVEIISKDVDGIVLKVLNVLNDNGIPLEKIRIRLPGYDFVCTNFNFM